MALLVGWGDAMGVVNGTFGGLDREWHIWWAGVTQWGGREWHFWWAVVMQWEVVSGTFGGLG